VEMEALAELLRDLGLAGFLVVVIVYVLLKIIDKCVTKLDEISNKLNNISNLNNVLHDMSRSINDLRVEIEKMNTLLNALIKTMNCQDSRGNKGE